MEEIRELSLPSKLENLDKVEQFSMELKRWAKLSDERFNDVMLILTEAVTNAIIHGNKQDPAKFVTITTKLDDQNLTFIIRDEGSGFDPDKVPNPLKEENLLKTGGRGIYLINQYADYVHYSEKGNQVTIIFEL